MKTQTRKEFLKSCCWLALSSLGLPLAALGRGPATRQTRDASGKKDAEGKEIIAFCGISCTKCPAYIATQKNDDRLRAETAREWSELFKASIKPEDINCDGCNSDSERLFSQVTVCEIRKCAMSKGLESCAPCAEFPCQKLSELFSFVPEAKTTLEEIRKKNR